MEMTHSSCDDQADHHPEEEEHQESGASKMFRKVKARAKKFKNSLTKHGNDNDHDVDEEDDENDEQVSELHDASVYESSAVSGSVTGHPESLSHPKETNVPATTHNVPMNTPVSLLSATEDVKRTFAPGDDDEFLGGQQKVNTDENQAAPGGGSDYLSGESKKFPVRSDDVKVETGDLPAETHNRFSPELSRPNESDSFDPQVEQTRDEPQEPKPITYTEQIGSATSFITDKAIAAKNAVASSLGYGSAGGKHECLMGVETPRTASGTVTEKLTPVEEKDKETGSNVIAKLPLSGGGIGSEETEQGEEKGVSNIDDLTEKLKRGEEDKALSEGIAEKHHIGKGGEEEKKKKIPSDQIQEETEHSEAVAEEGMVGKIKGAYNYWLGGTKEEVKPKSPDSVEESSSQSLGSTIGTKGFSNSGESVLGDTGGHTGAVPVQRGL